MNNKEAAMINMDEVLARMMRDVINDDLSQYEAKKILLYLDPAQGQEKIANDRDTPPIETLNLSARSHNSLQMEGITHLAMLTRLPRWQIMRIPNIGIFSMNEIILALKDKGLQLNTEYQAQKNVWSQTPNEAEAAHEQEDWLCTQ